MKEGRQWMRGRPRIEAGWRRHTEAVLRCAFQEHPSEEVVRQIETRLTLSGDVGVAVDGSRYPIGSAVDNARQHHAAIAVAQQNDVR